jgi:thiol-disulfide isomerase/thioredoxin
LKTIPTELREKTAGRFSLVSLAILLSTTASGCSSLSNTGSNSGLQVPKVYSAKVVAEYRDLANEGYQALNDGEVEKAVARFTAQLNLVPEGKLGAYNLACVYGRTGDAEKGIHWLKETVKNGWDSPDDLLYDSDLTSLRSSPEFDSLVEQSKATRDEKDKMFAVGLPEYKTPPVTFATQDELDEWSEAQNAILKAHRSIWQNWQQAAAKLDFYAKHLATEKALRKDDTTYDYALTRVRTIGSVKTIWDCWGSLSDGVVKEADSYLATNPTQAGADEANYYAGMALAKKLCDDDPTPEQVSALEHAQSYFSEVSADSPLKGSAEAWLMDYKLEHAATQSQEEVQALYADVRTLIEKCRQSKDFEAMRIISVGFHNDAVQSMWPLDLNQPDLAGKNVSLADYKGKVVLIDFWATWCGPCIAELPNLKAVYQKYRSQGFEVIGVSLDYDTRLNAEQLQQWTKKNGMSWRHIYEGKGWDIKLADRFMVKSIPSVFLIGRDGSLVAMGEEVHGENLEKAVQKALTADIH